MSDTEKTPERCYVPGYTWTKTFMAIVGAVIAFGGVAQMWEPVRAVIVGSNDAAEVSAIIVEQAGSSAERHTAPRIYEEDPRRRLVYGYEVRMPSRREAVMLSSKNRVRPAYEIGAAVRVAWLGDTPYVFPVWDLRTWAPGMFLLVSGGVFCGAFVHLAVRSRRPIPVPSDVPADVAV